MSGFRQRRQPDFEETHARIHGILFEGIAEGHTVDWNHFGDAAEGVVFTLGGAITGIDA